MNSITKFIKKHKFKILAGISFIAAGYFFYQYSLDTSSVKLSSFLQAIESNQIDEIMIDGENIFFRAHNSDWYRTFLGDYSIKQLFSLILNKDIVFSNQKSLINREIVIMGVSCIISTATFKFMMNEVNKPDISSVDLKSNIYSSGNGFDDYYGGEDIKEKFHQIIDFLNNPQKYQNMGARIRRGVLLYGPPGTGKTLLARALANQAGCNFIRAVASQFQQIFVGVGPKRVRQLFQNARKSAGGCIIFIDQIDALGSRLNHLRDSHETTTTINQFLSEMDGFSPLQKVIIIGATNRIDLVDHAILRAGRFDLKIHIPLPNYQQRKGILQKILFKKVGSLSDVDQQTIDWISAHSQNWCGADLQTLANESIYKAIQDNKQYLSSSHLKQSFQQLAVKK